MTTHQAISVDSFYPEEPKPDHIPEVSGVLRASVDALLVIQQALSHEDQQQNATLQQWQGRVEKIHQEFVQCIRDLKGQMEEAQRIAFEKENLSLKEYGELISSTISHSMNNILNVSKGAMTMVFVLDEVMTSLATIDQFTSEVKALNKQANMLAVNASIEAVRAGQAGQNFAVVATEVKEIADQIKSLSGDLHGKVRELSSTVTNGYGVLQEIATIDLQSNLDSKARMDALLENLTTQQQHTETQLQQHTQDQQQLLRRFDDLMADVKQRDPATIPALCKAITCVISRQATLKSALMEQSPEARTAPPDEALVQAITTALLSPELVELFRNSLQGKDVALHHAMQRLRHVSQITTEE